MPKILIVMLTLAGLAVQHSLGLRITNPPADINVAYSNSCLDMPQRFEYTHLGKFSSCPIQMTRTKWDKNSWDGKVLMIHAGGGRFGNQVFYAAATLVAAAKDNRPVLVVKSKLGWGLGELPCLQSTAGLEAALASGVCKNWSEEELLKPNGIETSGCLAEMEKKKIIQFARKGGYQQNLALWGNDPESFFPMLRDAFSVHTVVADLPEKPGPNDLVLYFRSYGVGVSDNHKGCKRLLSPPVKFFKHAIEKHQTISTGHRDGRIWVVAAPDQREHPTIQRLVRECNAVMYTSNDHQALSWLYDFAFVSAAKHVATSFSTFGWWATVVGNPKTVYFPIMPGKVPMMSWCAIMAKGDQYVYVDWWTNYVYSGGKGETKRALQVCNNYETDEVAQNQKDQLDTFYPELKS